MKRVVFYSWQSDLPNATNRGFIQDALTKAAKSIASDDTIDVEPVVDRDTQGTAGSPDIASTIFAKITAADVFVADVSITCRPATGKVTPNPNVLLELGYAYKALGHERIILVFNKAFGDVTELPFDLRMRKVMQYNMPEENTDRATERKELQSGLDEAIRAAFEHAPAVQQDIQSIAAIENVLPNRVLLLRRDLVKVIDQLAALEPPNYTAGGRVPDSEAALAQTQETVAEFGRIAETIAVMNDETLIPELVRFFASLFEKYQNPKDFAGQSSNADHDYFRFLGHELFLMLLAALIREKQWGFIFNLLNEPIPLRHDSRTGRSRNAKWHEARQALPSFMDEGNARRRLSLQADILKDRHGKGGGLETVVSFEELEDADFFMYLYCNGSDERRQQTMHWYPVTGIYMEHSPAFLGDAEQRKTAAALARVFGMGSADDLKSRLLQLEPEYQKMFTESPWKTPFDDDVIKRIGTLGLAQFVKAN